MKHVYVVTAGGMYSDYSDYHIVAVFEDKDMAEEFGSRSCTDWDVETYKLITATGEVAE